MSTKTKEKQVLLIQEYLLDSIEEMNDLIYIDFQREREREGVVNIERLYFYIWLPSFVAF